MWYKYNNNSLIRIERRTGHGCNSRRLHQKEIKMPFKNVLGDYDDDESSCTNGC